MTYLQNALNEGAMSIMLNDAIASINYFNYYEAIVHCSYFYDQIDEKHKVITCCYY